jgi:hypothetical protein
VAQSAGAPAKEGALIRWVDTRTFAAASPGDVPWPTAPTASQPQTAVRGHVSAGVTR